MCTFENEHRVLVCDVAIHRVREAVSAAFGEAVQLTPIAGQGTRIEAGPSIDGEAFQDVTRSAISGSGEARYASRSGAGEAVGDQTAV